MTQLTAPKSALTQEYNDALARYMEELSKHPYHVQHGYKFELTRGVAYDKIFATMYGSKSIHCFVQRKNGDLLKAATYKAPAKGKRGSIFDQKRPVQCGDFYRG